MLFFVSLFAELIANDRPILIRYDGAFYSPLVRDYPETTFGGEFPTDADYSDDGRAEADRGQGLDAVAADPLPLRHASLKGEGRKRPRRRRWRTTGWAPTTRRATCWPG